MIPRSLLAFATADEHCLCKVSLLSIKIPRSLSTSDTAIIYAKVLTITATKPQC